MHACILSRTAILVSFLLVIMVLASPALAEDSLLINYQGYLTDAEGQPMTTSVPMGFTIYSSPSGIGSLWGESYLSVEVNAGFFNVVLGSVIAMPASVFDGSNRWLGISVNYDADISPRTLMTAVAAAGVAKAVKGDIITLPGILQIHPPEPCVPPEPCQPVRMEVYPAQPCDPANPCSPVFELVSSEDTSKFVVHPPDPCVPPDPCNPAVEVSATSTVNNLKLAMPLPEDASAGSSAEICTGLGEAGIIIINSQPTGDSSAVGIDTDTSQAGIIIINNHEGETNSSVDIGTDASQAGIIIINSQPTGDSSAVGIDTDTSQAGIIIINNSEGGTSSSIDMGTDASEAGIIIINSQPTGESSAVEIGTDASQAGIIIINSQPVGSAPGLVMNATGDAGALSVGWFEPSADDVPPSDDGMPAAEFNMSATTGTFELHGEENTIEMMTHPIYMHSDGSGAKMGVGTTDLTEALCVIGNIALTGEVVAYTETYMKTDIAPIENALETIDALNGVSYDWRKDKRNAKLSLSDRRQIGLLADDVEKVLPELVHRDADGNRMVAYSKLTAVLIEAVKELKAENEELKTRIEKLERK